MYFNLCQLIAAEKVISGKNSLLDFALSSLELWTLQFGSDIITCFKEVVVAESALSRLLDIPSVGIYSASLQLRTLVDSSRSS